MSSKEDRAAKRQAIADLRAADKALNDNSDRERRAGIREETPEYQRLNAAANAAAAKVSRWRGGTKRGNWPPLPAGPAPSADHEGAAMDLTRYRVEDADGTFLDQFTTNAPDIADQRIAHTREFHPDLTVTQTADNR
ncbi:hypothetical protein [Streptomyces sp. NPDC048516]|uniref:hypothetical protein n=1 Tax=Streptomyces sp. NPDC048516 TaxID=3365565 RepID=UPI00371AF42D